jgi:hypothetical protein
MSKITSERRPRSHPGGEVGQQKAGGVRHAASKISCGIWPLKLVGPSSVIALSQNPGMKEKLSTWPPGSHGWLPTLQKSRALDSPTPGGWAAKRG